MTVIESFANWAVRERSAALGPEVRHHTRRAVIDWFAALLPGGIIAPATLLEKTFAEDMGRGKARLVSGQLTTLRTAALINGTASHSVEFDDIYRDAGFHPGSPIISAALAAAQTVGADGDAFARAVIVGYEISSRIGERVMPSHYRYWHSTGTLGSFGAAAAVASLLKCDAVQFGHALATAGTFAAGLQQAFRSESNSKPFHSGHAAETGVLAAMTAKQGVTGALDLLEGAAGFGAAMSEGANWDGVTDDLGQRYCINQITFKNHGCCGHNFAPIDGVLHMQAVHGFRPQDIKSIKVATYQLGVDVVNNANPSGEYQAKFSLQYVVAHALVYGSVRMAAFTPARMSDPAVRALLGRITVTDDAELSALYPSQRAARIDIELLSGERFTHLQPTRKGDPEMPLTDQELQDKFHELAAPVIGAVKAKALLASCWSIEQRSDMDIDFSLAR
jgi:2-methylcitrate dehydratase PrpD